MLHSTWGPAATLLVRTPARKLRDHRERRSKPSIEQSSALVADAGVYVLRDLSDCRLLVTRNQQQVLL